MIPILIGIFVYLNTDIKLKSNVQKVDSFTLKEINKYQSKIIDIRNNENKKFKQINILKIFEILSKDLNIKIQKYKFDKNVIQLIFNAKFKNSIKFLDLIEEMALIRSVELYYDLSILYVDLELEIKISKNIDISNIIQNENIANPFILKKDAKKNKIVSKAIIGKYLILNNRWYKVGDKYKKYIIKKIAINYIELEYKNKITKMEIFDDKNYR